MAAESKFLMYSLAAKYLLISSRGLSGPLRQDINKSAQEGLKREKLLVKFKQYETFISGPCIREPKFQAQGAFSLPIIKATIHRSNIAKSYIYMRTFFIFAIHGANRPCKTRRLKHGKTAADFQYFQPMAAHIAKRSPRKLILSIFSPWPHIRPKVAPGSSF